MTVDDIGSFLAPLALLLTALGLISLIVVLAEIRRLYPKEQFRFFFTLLLALLAMLALCFLVALIPGEWLPGIVLVSLQLLTGMLSILVGAAAWQQLEHFRALDQQGLEAKVRQLTDELSRHDNLGQNFEQLIYERTRDLEAVKHQLEKDELRYRVVSEALTQVIYVMNEEGKAVQPQPSWERYTGQNWQQGYTPIAAVPESSRAELRALFAQMQGGDQSWCCELELWSAAASSYRNVRCTVVPIRDSLGHVEEWVAALEDVEDRQQAERSFERLLNIAPVAMMAIDEAGGIVFANDAANELFGYESSDLHGQTVEIFEGQEPGSSPIEEDIRALMRSPTPVVFGDRADVFASRSDGSKFPVQATVASAHWQGRPVLIGAYVDLSASRDRHLENLEKANRALRNSNTDLEQFAYVASHDLKSPARKMGSFATILREDLGETVDDDTRQLLDAMVNSSGRMTRLIDDLLAYARISQHPEPPKPVDLNTVIEAVSADLALDEVDGSGELLVRLEPGKLPQLTGHEAQLHRLFANLINNAIKFTPEDRPCQIVIDSERRSNHAGESEWLIRVQDNGEGIPASDIERIFVMFERLHGANIEGSGLGLAICVRIMQEHKGSISVQSEEGVGSCFTLRFPAD